jgi:altronate dehydratase
MAQQFLIMNPSDNVAVALVRFNPGDQFETPTGSLRICDEIPIGHKVAIREIPSGDFVFKYGERIGRATSLIRPGAHAHVHNIEDITEEIYLEERRKLGL